MTLLLNKQAIALGIAIAVWLTSTATSQDDTETGGSDVSIIWIQTFISGSTDSLQSLSSYGDKLLVYNLEKLCRKLSESQCLQIELLESEEEYAQAKFAETLSRKISGTLHRSSFSRDFFTKLQSGGTAYVIISEYIRDFVPKQCQISSTINKVRVEDDSVYFDQASSVDARYRFEYETNEHGASMRANVLLPIAKKIVAAFPEILAGCECEEQVLYVYPRTVKCNYEELKGWAEEVHSWILYDLAVEQKGVIASTTDVSRADAYLDIAVCKIGGARKIWATIRKTNDELVADGRAVDSTSDVKGTPKAIESIVDQLSNAIDSNI